MIQKILDQIDEAYKTLKIKPCDEYNFILKNKSITHVSPLWVLALNKKIITKQDIIKDNFGKVWDWCDKACGTDWTNGFLYGYDDKEYPVATDTNKEFLKGYDIGNECRKRNPPKV